MRRLPPLNALRAFEAAARRRSFQRAADELSVTPSAVSHQVRALEEWLGVRLLERTTRRVRPTEAGQEYLAAVSAVLDQLDAATQRLTSSTAAPVLVLQVAPTFAMGWLVHHLHDFEQANPDLEVRLTLTDRRVPVDFDASDVDLAVVSWADERPELERHRLMGEDLVPVCSPALVAPRGPLRVPADLARVTLLHVMPRADQWRAWLAAAGVSGVAASRGPRFQSTPLAIEAALAGAGVVIANREFVARHLEAGRLVAPFDLSLPPGSGYSLIYPRTRRDDPRIAAFRDWLLAAVGAPEEETAVTES